MAKKKEANFTDLLVKIKRVFAKDIYILFGRWVAGGELSDANNAGVFLLDIEPEYQELLRGVFQIPKESMDIIYIQDISWIKTATTMEEYSQFSFHTLDKQESENLLKTRIQSLLDIAQSDISYFPFRFSEDEQENQQKMDLLFKDQVIVPLYCPTGETPFILIGKTMLPGISEKESKNLAFTMMNYHTDGGEPIYEFLISYQFTHYQMFGQFFFI